MKGTMKSLTVLFLICGIGQRCWAAEGAEPFHMPPAPRSAKPKPNS